MVESKNTDSSDRMNDGVYRFTVISRNAPIPVIFESALGKIHHPPNDLSNFDTDWQKYLDTGKARLKTYELWGKDNEFKGYIIIDFQDICSALIERQSA